MIAVGATVLLGLGSAIFKTASLRGDMNLKWSRRVAFAVAALDEKALAELSNMQYDIMDMSGKSPSTGFDPGQAIVDPAPLLSRAEQTVKFYRARQRMERDVKRLCDACPVMLVSLAGWLVADILTTLFFAEIWQPSWLEAICFVLISVFGLLLFVSGGVYVGMHYRLANAEMLARSAGQVETGDEK